MEKNNYQRLSEKDLDQLLNRAFLDLDFNGASNQRMLESVGERALLKKPFSIFNLKKIVISKFFISVSLLAIITGLWLWLKPSEAADKNQISDNRPAGAESHHPEYKLKTADIKTVVPVQKERAPGRTENAGSPVKKEREETPAAIPEVQEVSTISGYIKSAKTKRPLAGALVYKLNSSVSISASEQGYFALNLPKGEHQIGISMAGYQTLTVSITIQEDVIRDIELNEVWKQLDEVTVQTKNFIFPNLTEWEKKANEKEKKAMAKLAARLKRDKSEQKYAFIPGSADQSISEFYMGSEEVTNLEYRTFLFDLLIHDRKEEFLLAKPEQELWVNAAGRGLFDTLSKVYFSTRRYNKHPVVNISPVGAAMYCKWLSQIANELRRKEGKAEITMRLPYEKEWLYAAGGGHPSAIYPWPSDSVQNRVNWFLANCCIQKLSDQFKYPLGHHRKFAPNAYTSAGMSLGDNRVATVEVFAYNPNDFNLYCMCGNASEMVLTEESKILKAKGGSWNSDFKHLRLDSEDEFKGDIKPSPMIGFRVCTVVKK